MGPMIMERLSSVNTERQTSRGFRWGDRPGLLGMNLVG